jgi:hypothetical protein
MRLKCQSRVLHVFDVSQLVLLDTWHNGNVYLVDTWQIVHFTTTEFTTPRTRGHLHMSNSLPCVWGPYTGKLKVAKCKFFCSAFAIIPADLKMARCWQEYPSY